MGFYLLNGFIFFIIAIYSVFILIAIYILARDIMTDLQWAVRDYLQRLNALYAERRKIKDKSSPEFKRLTQEIKKKRAA